MTTLTNDIVRLLGAHRFRFGTEAVLQDGIAEVLAAAGIQHEREVALTARDRIDFLVQGGIGLEVKIDGSALDLARQMLRYAAHERIAALLVVTTRARHTETPRELGGKPVRVIHLTGSCL